MADPWNQRSWKAEISTDQNPNPFAFNTPHEFLCDSPGATHMLTELPCRGSLIFCSFTYRWSPGKCLFGTILALCQNPTANLLFRGYECLWYSPNGSKCFMSVFSYPPSVDLSQPGVLVLPLSSRKGRCLAWDESSSRGDDTSHLDPPIPATSLVKWKKKWR